MKNEIRTDALVTFADAPTAVPLPPRHAPSASAHQSTSVLPAIVPVSVAMIGMISRSETDSNVTLFRKTIVHGRPTTMMRLTLCR